MPSALMPLITIGVCALFFFTTNAHAYLDPGTGSVILQAVIAAAVGALFAVKIWWTRIKQFFRRKSSRSKEGEPRE